MEFIAEFIAKTIKEAEEERLRKERRNIMILFISWFLFLVIGIVIGKFIF